MGWGVFCALCGGPFEGDILPYDGYLYPEDRGLSDEQLREFTAETYCMEYDDCCDSSVLKRQSIAWLKDLRVIGKGNHKAFITGIGQEFESGSVSVDPGDDPNVPTPDQLNAPLQPGRLRHEVYFTSLNTLDHPSFPMHAKCFDVLTEAHKHRSITKDGRQIPLDLEKLHRGMSKRYPAHYTHLGLRKYAEFAEGIGQWWTGPFASLEPWYHDPLDIPVLTALNKTEQPRRVRVWARGTESAANCLSDLPVELLVLIANHLDTKSVIKLTRTCREVNAILSKNLWRNRLFLDMPYLFEIRDKVNQDAAASSSIDWQDLYGRMMLQSYPGKWDRVWWKFTDSSRKLPDNADFLLEILGGYGRKGLLRRGNMVSKFDPGLIGIASRRRVWQCAEELLDICEGYALEEESDTSSSDSEEAEIEESDVSSDNDHNEEY